MIFHLIGAIVYALVYSYFVYMFIEEFNNG